MFGDLGERFVDRTHDWFEDSAVFPKSCREYQKFIDKTKIQSYDFEKATPMCWSPPTKSQKKVLQTVNKFLDLPNYEQLASPLKLLIVGTAGSGKSWVIEEIVSAFRARGKQSLITAATGPASHLIGGVTLHNAFSVPFLRDENWEDLTAKTTPSEKLISRLRDVDLLIIDEVTLLGAGFLNFINKQLQLCHDVLQPFGHASVILVGDIPSQIPPIGDVALYRDPSKYNKFIQDGISLYLGFKNIIVLREKLLYNLRRKQIGPYDIQVLRSRLEKNVDPDILLNEFRDCLRIFPRRSMCNAYNRQKILAEGMPVIKIGVKQIPSSPQMQDFEPLVLGKGVKVMLTRNLDTNRGLTTGARGVVRGLLWDKKKTPGNDIPSVILVEFEKKVFGPRIENN
ncbi:ATP-dependent DNA helicase pif1 [Folsomia candida]|uniref:ATP-dependent DNA helicase n=1 Tax=Folsomia candida TaxID=158441 RepID=A0A226DRQ3_FOLCA|nr:ATP-dependent DNA helicase pif1 [Folsomia candida]OXA47371.1 ATP-dependent DNA helicase pif1 [Folsomia candida]